MKSVRIDVSDASAPESVRFILRRARARLQEDPTLDVTFVVGTPAVEVDIFAALDPIEADRVYVERTWGLPPRVKRRIAESVFDGAVFSEPESSVWADAMKDPFLGAPPWAIAREAPLARVVAEAKGLEAAALRCLERGEVLTARGCQKFADACWVGALVALMQGRV